MNFDFLELYKDHTNIQLLQILENPESYQPSAVNAARELLAYRVVTDADLAAVNPPVSETKVFEEESIADLVDRLTNPSSTTNKWVMPFIVVVMAYCAYAVFNTLQLFWARYQIGFQGYFMPAMLTATIAYNVVLCTLLLKRNKWGWLLFAAHQVVVISADMGRIVMYIGERGEHILSSSFLMGQLVLHAGLLFCLWSEPISGAFNISQKVKTGYLAIALMLALRAVYIAYTVVNVST